MAEEQPNLIRAPIQRALPFLDALLSQPLPSSSLGALLYYKMKAMEFLLDLTSDTAGGEEELHCHLMSYFHTLTWKQSNYWRLMRFGAA